MTETATKSPAGAFAAVTVLFFAWGFITSLVDPLVAAVKGIFTLTTFEANAATFAFFIAYGVASLPAAWLLSRLRAVPTILFALGLMIAGCLVMLAAANLAVFPLVLAGLFVLACGITVLQVAANPLAAALGKPEGSHFRLTLSQTFNSLGTFLGPLIGAQLFLAGVEVKHGATITPEARAGALEGIDSAYFWIAGLIAALALFFWLSRSTITRAAPPPSTSSNVAEAFASRWALLGALAIFLYVGAEVAIGTQMALFLNDDAIWGQSDAAFAVPLLGHAMVSDGVAGVSLQEAGRAVAFYWGGAMIGRGVGAALLARIKAAPMLAVFTAGNALLCLYVVMVGGVSAGFVALSMGLFNSIMFPVIFTLTLERSSASEEATSGLLCLAIIGGAFVPLLTARVSDMSSYSTSLVVPGLCYLALCAFAVRAGRAAVRRKEEESAIASIH